MDQEKISKLARLNARLQDSVEALEQQLFSLEIRNASLTGPVADLPEDKARETTSEGRSDQTETAGNEFTR